VISVDTLPWRLEMSERLGADVALDATQVDVVEEVRRLTGGWMADVAVEAVGTPLDEGGFMGGIGEKRILSTTAPGG
jgi:threonine dehydrogenase-like Zn-dependent dehydrogenase